MAKKSSLKECSNCGKQIPINAKFCINCGAKVGNLQFSPDDNPKSTSNKKKRGESVKKTVDQDAIEALIHTGKSYRKAKQFKKAREVFHEAADQGSGEAMLEIGKMYENGEGLPQNITKAISLYAQGAAKGSGDANYFLGIAFEEGKSVPQNFVKAHDYYFKALFESTFATSDNYTKATTRLKMLKETIDRTIKANKAYNNGDYEKAFEMALPLAKQGVGESQLVVGLCFYFGNGIAKNRYEAVEWIKKAVNRGEAGACLMLGDMYRLGMGVDKDYSEAVRLLKYAVSQGGEQGQSAQKKLDELYKMAEDDKTFYREWKWKEIYGALDLPH